MKTFLKLCALCVICGCFAGSAQGQTGTTVTGTTKTADEKTPAQAGLKAPKRLGSPTTGTDIYGTVEVRACEVDSQGRCVKDREVVCGTNTYLGKSIGYIKGDGTWISPDETAGIKRVPNAGCTPAGLATEFKITLQPSVAEAVRLQAFSITLMRTVPDVASIDFSQLTVPVAATPAAGKQDQSQGSIFDFEKWTRYAAASVPSAAAGSDNVFIDTADNKLKARDSAGTLRELGGGGGSTTISIDAVNLSTQSPLNFQDTTEIDWTNPSAGNVQIALKAGSVVESKLSLNFPTHANTNDPTADQKAALAGSSGTPSVTNKYVTDADPRNSDARTPVAHNQDWSTITTGRPTTLSGYGITDAQALDADLTAMAALTPLLGGTFYVNATPAWAQLAGNTTTTKKYLSQTGDGALSAAPSWSQPASADLSDAANIPLLNAGNVFAAGQIIANQNALYLRELGTNGVDAIYHRAAAAITTSGGYTWPEPAAGLLRSDAGGVLSLAPITGSGSEILGCTTSALTAGEVFSWDGSKCINSALSQELSDNLFRITDNADNTKKLAFEVSGISPSTTRTFTPPDRDMTFFGAGVKYATTDLTGNPTTDNCVKWLANGVLGDAGAACGSGGGGDSVQFNGSAVNATVNFLNVTATGSVAGVTWTLTAASPDTATFALSAASSTLAGIVTNAAQDIAGAKNFINDVTAPNLVLNGSSPSVHPSVSSKTLTVGALDATGANSASNTNIHGADSVDGAAGDLDISAGGPSGTGTPGRTKLSQPFKLGSGTHTLSNLACLTADHKVDDCGTSATNFIGVFQANALSDPVHVRLMGEAVINYDATVSPAFDWNACSSATVAGKVTVQSALCSGIGRFVGKVVVGGASVTSGLILIKQSTPFLLVSGDIPNNAANTSGTAAALAANGGNCSGNNFALGVDAAGVGECAQPAFSNLSGSVAIAQTPLTTLGDLLYADATPALARLAGNITTTKKYLSQTGNGSISAAPGWSQPAFSELSGSATAGQVPNLESLNGTLTLAKGGTNQTAWTASRCVQVNAGGTALESAAAACGAGGASLTVEEADANPTVASVTKIQFDSADGLTVTDETGGQVQIDCVDATTSVKGCLTAADWTTFNGKPNLITAGSNGTEAVNAGDNTTAARSDHEHNFLKALTWYFPGTPAGGVQTAHALVPEGVAGCTLTDSRISVNTAASTNTTWNIKRCTTGAGDCTAVSNIYTSSVTLNSSALSVAGGAPNTTTVSAGDAFKVDLVSVGTNLADVTVALSYKCKNTN